MHAARVVVVWDHVSVPFGVATWDWSDQVEAADWIVERLHPFARDVGSVIPDGFDAYVPRVSSGARARRSGRRQRAVGGDREPEWSFCVPPFPQTPNLWWPEDRAWCVATEIDLAWTYVGGSSELAATLLGDRRLEALAATVEDRFTIDSDLLNR